MADSGATLPRDFSRVLLTLENVLIPAEKLSVTPSMLDGLAVEVEVDLRMLGCEMIQTAGILLKLPQVSQHGRCTTCCDCEISGCSIVSVYRLVFIIYIYRLCISLLLFHMFLLYCCPCWLHGSEWKTREWESWSTPNISITSRSRPRWRHPL